MEVFVKIIGLLLFIGVLATPIVSLIVFSKIELRFKFIWYLLVTIFITSGFTIVFAWWADYSNNLLLSYYGYDSVTMGNTNRFADVLPKDKERVQQLLISVRGIGWPLKAMMLYPMIVSYLAIIYGIDLVRIKFLRKKS